MHRPKSKLMQIYHPFRASPKVASFARQSFMFEEKNCVVPRVFFRRTVPQITSNVSRACNTQPSNPCHLMLTKAALGPRDQHAHGIILQILHNIKLFHLCPSRGQLVLLLLLLLLLLLPGSRDAASTSDSRQRHTAPSSPPSSSSAPVLLFPEHGIFPPYGFFFVRAHLSFFLSFLYSSFFLLWAPPPPRPSLLPPSCLPNGQRWKGLGAKTTTTLPMVQKASRKRAPKNTTFFYDILESSFTSYMRTFSFVTSHLFARGYVLRKLNSFHYFHAAFFLESQRSSIARHNNIFGPVCALPPLATEEEALGIDSRR